MRDNKGLHNNKNTDIKTKTKVHDIETCPKLLVVSYAKNSILPETEKYRIFHFKTNKICQFSLIDIFMVKIDI